MNLKNPIIGYKVTEEIVSGDCAALQGNLSPWPVLRKLSIELPSVKTKDIQTLVNLIEGKTTQIIFTHLNENQILSFSRELKKNQLCYQSPVTYRRGARNSRTEK